MRMLRVNLLINNRMVDAIASPIVFQLNMNVMFQNRDNMLMSFMCKLFLHYDSI